MYRFIIVFFTTIFVLAACSKPVAPEQQNQSAVCERLSKQMINNDNSMGQPTANSSQLTQAKLLKQYQQYGCL